MRPRWWSALLLAALMIAGLVHVDTLRRPFLGEWWAVGNPGEFMRIRPNGTWETGEGSGAMQGIWAEAGAGRISKSLNGGEATISEWSISGDGKQLTIKQAPYPPTFWTR